MEICHFDVVVAGGGPSGACAAITAARAGVKTALIQNRPVLGGNSSSEIRVWTRGSVGGGSLYAEEMGVFGEMKLHNLHINPDYNPVLWDEVLLDKVLAEPNITLFLNSHVTDVQMHSPERIRALIVSRMGTEEQFKICGKIFVDATGDGTVGYLANAAFREGREATDEYDESLAMPAKDNYREGSTLMFQSKDEGKPIRFAKPDYAYDIPYIEKLLDRGGRIVDEKMNGCDYWWLEYGGTKDTIRDNQEIMIELKRLVMGVWNYIKNSGKFDADTLTLEWVGNVPGKRESRRFIGNYTLTQNDLEQERSFPDAVCCGGWYMDFHPSEGIYSDGAFCTQIPVFAYQIPMRCFFTDSLQNLVFTGRNISTTHAAFSSSRVMDTCSQVGQASGEIAAQCALHDCSPSQAYERHLETIQQELLKADLNLLGIGNRDPGDKARKAEITASSVRAPENRASCGTMDLKEESFLAAHRGVGALSLTVGIECDRDTALECTLFSCRLPSRKVDGEKVCTFTCRLKKGQPSVRIDLSRAPKHCYVKLVFAPNPDVRLKISRQSMTGFLVGHKESPEYFHPCLSADAPVYGAENVVNGFARPQNGVNLWCSESPAEGQWLQLKWTEAQTVSQIRLTFNPDLSMELPSSISKISSQHHGFARREGDPKELVRSFSVLAFRDGQWTELARKDGNYQRLCVVNFPEAMTDRIRIVFHETGGSPFAEVFEVRAY
ncbi:FAD-dependent oxidoreductase [Caproiciproducens sp.]